MPDQTIADLIADLDGRPYTPPTDTRDALITLARIVAAQVDRLAALEAVVADRAAGHVEILPGMHAHAANCRADRATDALREILGIVNALVPRHDYEAGAYRDALAAIEAAARKGGGA